MTKGGVSYGRAKQTSETAEEHKASPISHRSCKYKLTNHLKQFDLFALPPELWIHVCRFAVSENSTIRIDKATPTPITEVCKVIRHEALKLYCLLNEFACEDIIYPSEWLQLHLHQVCAFYLVTSPWLPAQDLDLKCRVIALGTGRKLTADIQTMEGIEVGSYCKMRLAFADDGDGRVQK